MTRSLPSTSTQSSTRRKVQPLSFLVRPLGPLRQTISSRLAQAGRKLPVSSRRCSLAAALTQSPPHGSLALRATRSSPSVSAAPAASTAPAMLRPVHAVGHQFHHGRTDRREIDSHRVPAGWSTAESIHRVHLHLEAVQQAAPLALAAEPRLTAVLMCQGASEHALHEIRGAPLVGMGLRIACRRRDPKPGDRPALESQPSLRLKACANCTNTIAARWLQTE